MDQKRTKTLEALEEFIQAQQSLLDTTYSDIELLREARTAALTDPPTFIDNIHTRLDAPSFRLSSLPDWQLIIPKGLDWSVFEGLDPAPLQKYTLDAQLAYHARHEPHTTQKSPLSDLQKLVKSARRSIIDPVLAAFAQAPEIKKDNNNGEEESESEIDEEEIQREREREKIRQLKQRKIRTGGLRLPSRLRMEGSTAVFIRHDVEDESMDVDISMDHDGDDDVHNNRTTATVPRPPELSRSSRVVPLSRTRQDQATPAAPRSRSYKKARKEPPPKAPLSPLPVPPPTPKPVESTQKSGKPKPETYKQAWTLSEQHLLEQLLEQIPEGEKYRWQKISRAMNGRRTPRQVASRVQKYFEKLKKYGIEG